MKFIKLLSAFMVLGVVFYLGMRIGTSPMPSSIKTSPQNVKSEVVWTCVMHLHIERNEAGLCPVCNMELVLRDDSMNSPGGSDWQIRMNAHDKKLAAIATQVVERRFVEMPVRMVGKLAYDETQIKTISSWVDGRVDRLYVDYTGIQVKSGDHLVELYSPDLLTGQKELIEAKRRVDASGQGKSEFLRNSDLRALDNAREKLRLWGLSEGQVRAIEKNKKASDRILINSPQSGIVIHKALSEGDYVKTGTHIYTVANLEKLWVKLDAYESDLQWLHYGQSVELETEVYSGETFNGVISFIDPVVDDVTRTLKVRVNVDNSQLRLKPGMFVRATVHSKIAQGGKVMDPKLAGKWIGPMHPEIIRDEAGICPKCKMDLVKAESLGYVSADGQSDAPLVVPSTAVLRTGRRAVVYLEVEDSLYEGRELVLGPRAGDYYLVREGLNEGDVVVTNGNFNIDSALQIKAKPSMMSMTETVTHQIDLKYTATRVALEPVYRSYFSIQEALAADDLGLAKDKVFHLLSFLEKVKIEQAESIRSAFDSLSASEGIDDARIAFGNASKEILALEKNYGHKGKSPYFEAFCPMAFDNEGASWLQSSQTISNPFFGSSMLNCGSIENTFQGDKG
jgi:membrane fusion protein, copper/silver efflux system